MSNIVEMIIINTYIITICNNCRRTNINEGIINTVDYFVTVPYPGTELFINREKFSLTIKTQDWDQYREDSIPVFDLNTLSGAEIFECWKYGLTRFSETIEEKWKKGEQL